MRTNLHGTARHPLAGRSRDLGGLRLAGEELLFQIAFGSTIREMLIKFSSTHAPNLIPDLCHLVGDRKGIRP